MVEDIVRTLGYLTLGTRLKRISERMQADTQRILESCKLSIPAGQFPFLAAIDRLGPLTIGDLAKAVGVTQPGATRTVAQLAEARLLAIAPSSEDQRQKQVSLTGQGKRLVAEGKKVAWPAVERAVRNLCEELEGPLLDQLAAIEDSLSATPLHRRTQLGDSKRK
jgi:DNA-binding MarR family transcriptional regulator